MFIGQWLEWFWRRMRGLPSGRQTPTSSPVSTTTPTPEQKLAPVRRATAQPTRGVLDLVIGFDFGTSCSKVVIRTPYVADERAVAIPFPLCGHPRCPYLLPSRLYEGENGELTLHGDGSSQAFHELKVWMMNHPEDMDVLSLGASYLALAIRDARRWFMDEKVTTDYRGFDDYRWAVNVGIPSAGYDDAATRQAFLTAARAAWAMSQNGHAITTEWAKECVAAAREGGLGRIEAVSVVPEVAAQVAGYARSPMRRPGLHVLVDVGASTLDVCGFILHEQDGQDVWPLLTAVVEPLGVRRLHERRLSALGEGPRRESLGHVDPSDPLQSIPALGRDYAAEGSPHLQELDETDEQHMTECRMELMRVIIDLKTRRDPLSPVWMNGLPLFLCGGGARMDLFAKAVDAANTCMVELSIGTSGIDKRVLPKPDALVGQGVSDDNYDRLSVAYGLSYDLSDIGQVIPPEAIEDVEP